MCAALRLREFRVIRTRAMSPCVRVTHRGYKGGEGHARCTRDVLPMYGVMCAASLSRFRLP